ncbi:MAG: hypothetical protein OXL36_00970 [Bryobacterales bacterium]|nr:hypothetical protein [Bryobacterales bacterium]MDE0293544.1 hypothetical protein [Bryobacterales bacterium]
MTAGARDTTARTSLRLLAVLNVLSSTPARAKRLASRPDGPLTHFASPRGEKGRLEDRFQSVGLRDSAFADCSLTHFAYPRDDKGSLPGSC